MALNPNKIFLILIFNLLFTFLFVEAHSQGNNKVEVTLTARVDTSDAEIKEIVNLWINYLSSNPDSVYDNPYWNEEEKRKYHYFDLASKLMYQMPSEHLLSVYKPIILAVEPEKGKYSIRTLFYAEGLEPPYKSSNPWCSLRVYAELENGVWKLRNALPVLTENWKRKEIGKITFIYPYNHTFNEELARKSVDFCDSIAQVFNFPDWKPFEYYITHSRDELGTLLGFDYFFAGITTGIGYPKNGLLFSGFGTEWYPHELVHMIVESQKDRHQMINEGFATWLGGQKGKSFEENLLDLAKVLSTNDTLTFDDILNNRVWIPGAYYTTGAVLCEMMYEKGGASAIKFILDSVNNNSELYESIVKILGIKKEDFNKAWRKKVLEYANSKRFDNKKQR